ncbi:MAG: metalloregulator ArsR/SmtB family transcription factor [Pseudomonadota bacterium]
MPLCDISHIHAENVEKARDYLESPETILSLADVFKTLGDPTRLKMVMALQACELCVCDLAAVCGLSESAASHQLRVLRNLRIVANRRDGKIVFYRLADDHVGDLIRQSLAHVLECGTR